MVSERECVFCSQQFEATASYAGDVCLRCRVVMMHWSGYPVSRMNAIDEAITELRSDYSKWLDALVDYYGVGGADPREEAGSGGSERTCVHCAHQFNASKDYRGDVCLRCRLITRCRELNGRARQVFYIALRGLAADYQGVTDDDVASMAHRLLPGMFLSGR